MQYPLSLSFKVLAFAPQIFITDASGKGVLYVRQKALKFKEEIEVYTDDSKAKLLYHIKADRIIDFGATYHFTLADGTPVGSVKRQGMKSLWRSQYDIQSDGGGAPEFQIREKNPWIKVLDGLVSDIPFVGMFINPTYEVSVPGKEDQPLLSIIKKPAMFEGKFEIVQHQPLEVIDEYRVLLSVLMMILLERSRG